MYDQIRTDIFHLEQSIRDLIVEFEKKTSLRVSNIDYIKQEYEGDGLLSSIRRKVTISVKNETLT